MAESFSFDVVSDFDRQELVNTLDQVKREISQRYDLKGTDTLVELDKENIFMLTRAGQSIRFSVDSVRAVGRQAKGVRGISLKANDELISMENILSNSEEYCFSVTSRGFGKRTKLMEYRCQKRGGKGLIAHKVTNKTGYVVQVRVVKDHHQVLVMTTQGQSIRFSASEISVVGRASQGVRLMRLKAQEQIKSVSLVNEENFS